MISAKEIRERISKIETLPEDAWSHPDNQSLIGNLPFFRQLEDIGKGKEVAKRLQAAASDESVGISHVLSVIRAELPISEYTILNLLMTEHRIKKAIRQEASACGRRAVGRRHKAALTVAGVGTFADTAEKRAAAVKKVRALQRENPHWKIKATHARVADLFGVKAGTVANWCARENKEGKDNPTA